MLMLLSDIINDKSGPSNAVDIFDATSGKWVSTAALSVARSSLAATSLPNQGLAIFAGGRGMHVCRDL
jgi:hypothetical protein